MKHLTGVEVMAELWRARFEAANPKPALGPAMTPDACNRRLRVWQRFADTTKEGLNERPRHAL
jgi:hypothetical protein